MRERGHEPGRGLELQLRNLLIQHVFELELQLQLQLGLLLELVVRVQLVEFLDGFVIVFEQLVVERRQLQRIELLAVQTPLTARRKKCVFRLRKRAYGS